METDKKLGQRLLEIQESEQPDATDDLMSIINRRQSALERRAKIVNVVFAILVIVSVILAVKSGEDYSHRGNWLAITACFWMIQASMYMNQKWHAENALRFEKALAKLEMSLKRR